jgi:hypothetical protein
VVVELPNILQFWTPVKCRLSGWLLVQDRIPAADVLDQKNIQNESGALSAQLRLLGCFYWVPVHPWHWQVKTLPFDLSLQARFEVDIRPELLCRGDIRKERIKIVL